MYYFYPYMPGEHVAWTPSNLGLPKPVHLPAGQPLKMMCLHCACSPVDTHTAELGSV